MRPRIQPDEPTYSFPHKIVKRIIWAIILVTFIISTIVYIIPAYKFYYIPEELPSYEIRPKRIDDTLRIAFIGDSWADYQTLLSGDTMVINAAKKIYEKPVKAETRGKKGALSKEIYFFMFNEKTEEHSYEPDRCTQPLIEEHPDYCVIFAGINDVTYLRRTSFYAENMQLIIKHLLHNKIRPVIIEIPIVNFTEPMTRKGFKERWFYRIRSVLTGTQNNKGEDYQDALKEKLEETNQIDSVLYISVTQWDPRGSSDTDIFLPDKLHLNLHGYHILDSCIVSEIIRDHTERQRR